MGLRCVSGRGTAVKDCLMEELRTALAGEDAPLIVLVPEQYTLQAELDIVDALRSEGFFKLQVMSPARLYSRIFEQTGFPALTRVDERGRVLLLHAAMKRLRKDLTWYREAQHKSGFTQWMMQGIKELKQAHMTPEAAAEMAEGLPEGTLKYKLRDLSAIWALYEEALAGKFLDGEDERARALAAASKAEFLKGARVWAYGFEMVSPALADTLISLTGAAAEVALFLVMEADAAARDGYVYAPVARSLARLSERAGALSLPIRRVTLSETRFLTQRQDMIFLERELYCVPCRQYSGTPTAIRLVSMKNPREEAMFAAALARDLVMRRGWRYRDIAVICQDLAQYESALARACDLYDVPLFMESSRPAGRHPLAQYLLLSLKLLSRGWQEEDMRLLLQTGYTGLTEDEADRMANYAVSQGLRANGWKRPLRRGDEETVARLESVRARLTAPLLALEESLRGAHTVLEQMRALWQLLERIDAPARLRAEQARFTQMGLLEYANESAQVFNRLVGMLDQMALLLGEERLPLRDVYEMLTQSLMASDIKLLPQSADSLTAGNLNRLRTQPLKALLMLGCYDAGPASAEGLFEARERQSLRGMDVWLGPDGETLRALHAVDVKSALALTSDFFVATYPQSNGEGEALQSGALPMWLNRLFPKLAVSGGLRANENMERILLCARDAALAMLSPVVSEKALDQTEASVLLALPELPEGEALLRRLRGALSYHILSDKLSSELAKALYDGPQAVSVTRLEQFAACPFRHFAQYGLRPEEVVPYEVTPQDTGSFFHQAMEAFFRALDEGQGALSDEEICRVIDSVADRLLAPMLEGPLGEQPVTQFESRAMRRTVRRAAQAAMRHLQGSKFEPCAIEIRFGEGPYAITLKTGDDSIALRGRIDRLDRWADGEALWLRIVDYKSGQAQVRLPRLYFGLQLQLLIYLAVATEFDGGRPAGAFYFQIADPTLATEERDPAAVEEKRNRELRLSGLYVRDPRVLEAVSPHPEDVVRLRMKKDGTPYAAPDALDESELTLLMRYAVKIAERLTASIREGVTEIAPAKLGNELACDRCDFRALCLLDARLGGEPRLLPAIPSAQILERIRQAMDG